MNILTKEELWRCMLSKEPPKHKPIRHHIWAGAIFYYIMFRRYPRKVVASIATVLLILSMLIALCYLPAILSATVTGWDGPVQVAPWGFGEFLAVFAVFAIVIGFGAFVWTLIRIGRE